MVVLTNFFKDQKAIKAILELRATKATRVQLETRVLQGQQALLVKTVRTADRVM